MQAQIDAEGTDFQQALDMLQADVDQNEENSVTADLAMQADIEQNVTKAKENLKQEVSSLVLAGAAKILEKEVDAESNKQIIDDLIKEL